MRSLETAVSTLSLFGDQTRLRLVALLAQHELTVAELTSITELAQSRVSTHLGRLRDAGVLRDRRQGASTLYSLNDGAMPADARTLWKLLEQQVRDDVLEQDKRRATALVRAREKTAAWPDALAGRMERHYSPGRTWESMTRGLLGLVELGDVLDAGSGDGSVAQMLAPRARSVTLVDRSSKMIAAARDRLVSQHRHVRFSIGDVHALPFDDARFDAVLLFNVLAHARAPARTLAEAARVLRPRGLVAIVTLGAHDHDDISSAYGHVHPGFEPTALRRLLERADLGVESCEITSREKRPPHFEVLTAFARKRADDNDNERRP